MPPEAESSEVLNAILSPAPAAPAAGEASDEAPARAPASPGRDANGRFAAANQEAPETDDDAEQGDVAPEAAEAPDEALEAEEQTEEQAEEPAVPENLDDYTIEVVVDGKPAEVTLRELKQSYSGTQYIAARSPHARG